MQKQHTKYFGWRIIPKDAVSWTSVWPRTGQHQGDTEPAQNTVGKQLRIRCGFHDEKRMSNHKLSSSFYLLLYSSFSNLSFNFHFFSSDSLRSFSISQIFYTLKITLLSASRLRELKCMISLTHKLFILLANSKMRRTLSTLSMDGQSWELLKDIRTEKNYGRLLLCFQLHPSFRQLPQVRVISFLDWHQTELPGPHSLSKINSYLASFLQVFLMKDSI